jgi:hypothetical protein
VDERPTPRVPDPLFPVLRKLGATDVQRARSWLLAWLLNRLGQRVQEPPAASYYVQRYVAGDWQPVAGPFYRPWVAAQIATEFTRTNPAGHYRVVGPDGPLITDEYGRLAGELPHGE